MTSSDNLASIEPWTFHSAFADSWLSDALLRDTETLTKALQKSFSPTNTNNNNSNNSDHPNSDHFTSDPVSTYFNPETPTVSNVSGSEPESLPKRQRNGIPVSGAAKVSKRKSRASKRTQTTFITADPANFRQMVQQVTGVRFGNSQFQVPQILKPEPQRPGSRLPGIGGGGCLPTLDTSAFLLDHHQQQVMMEPGSGHIGGSTGFPFQSSAAAVGDGGGVGVGVGLDFENFPSFPTLESWKVM